MTRTSSSSDATTPFKQGIVSASKNTKAWRKRLRDACLDRVRLSQKKQRPCDYAQGQPNAMTTTMIAEEKLGGDDPRSLVEAQLKLHGVRIVSPTSKTHDGATALSMDWTESTTDDPIDESDEFVMTEDEVIALMEEIENEMKRHQEVLLEEELNRMEHEENALYESIADYEQWDEAVTAGQDSGCYCVEVCCPCCQESNLTTSSDASEWGVDVLCPNQMDGSCPLRLEARPGLSLHNLRDRLAQAFHDHGEGCAARLEFHVSKDKQSPGASPPITQLWAICNDCGTRACVA